MQTRYRTAGTSHTRAVMASTARYSSCNTQRKLTNNHCPQIHFLKLHRPISHFKINEVITIPAFKKSGIPRHPMELYPKECVFERNIQNLNLLLLLHQRRQGLSISWSYNFLYSFWWQCNSLWQTHRI